MATIRPFGALRFTGRAGNLEELTCPPYDIISESQRKQYLKRNPRNIIRLELPREGENPYETAGETLKQWMKDGYLTCDETPSYYIYEERFSVEGVEKSIKGLTCRVRLEEFDKGVVLPHEETLSKAKDDRFRLMQATGCNFSAIYSLYFDGDGDVFSRIEELSHGAPEMEFDGVDGIRHRVWQVTRPGELEAIGAAFEGKKLYIADGHHRYETGLRYRDYLRERGELTQDHPANYIMMTLVHMEHPGLVVQPTHRVVRELAGFDPQKLLADCGGYFDIDDISLENAEGEIARKAREGEKALALYWKGGCRLLTLGDAGAMEAFLPDCSEAYRRLDVSVLHTLILERLMGIDKENLAGQKNLIYTRDVAELEQMVEDGEANCGFIIGPTGVEEIAAVAGAGEKMPQKSTYFYPKLITGHIMNHIH